MFGNLWCMANLYNKVYPLHPWLQDLGRACHSAKDFFSQIMFSIVLLLHFLNKCTCLFFTSPVVVIYNVKMARVCHVYHLPGKLASEKKTVSADLKNVMFNRWLMFSSWMSESSKNINFNGSEDYLIYIGDVSPPETQEQQCSRKMLLSATDILAQPPV